MEKKVNNKELLETIADNSNAELRNLMPKKDVVVEGVRQQAYNFSETGAEVYAILEEYPTAKNEFINTLTNKIGKTLFFNKVFNNPLKMLHRGRLPYGKTIEEMFVKEAEQKGFNEHFNGSKSAEGDLIRASKPSVDVEYISQNYQYKFKTSISDDMLAGAFTSAFGLNELLINIVEQLYSTVESSEYEDMKLILTNLEKKSSGGSTIDVGVIPRFYNDPTTKENCIIAVGNEPNGKKVCKLIRAYANKMTFKSDKRNLAKVKTFTNKSELVLFITPDLDAEIDVEALAYAFNMSKVDVRVRTILVDELGKTKSDGNEVLAMLCDKAIVQAWDTVNKTNTFEVPSELYTNLFAHKHGIMGSSPYAEAIIFVKGDSVL